MKTITIIILLLLTNTGYAKELCKVTLYHLPETQRNGSIEFTRKTITVACEDAQTVKELDEWNGEGWTNLDSLSEWQDNNCK